MTAMTFFCDTWENSILLIKFLDFLKHLGKGYKITFAFNSSVSSFCFSQNLYCLYSSLGFCARTTLRLFTTLIAAKGSGIYSAAQKSKR